MSGTIQAWSNEIVFDWENETGSAPQQSDIDAWINAFENGASQSNLIVDLAESQAAGNAIGNLYERVLGRWVDPSGYQGCVDILASGGGLQTIEQDLAQSGECYNDIVVMFENATGGNTPCAPLISAFQYLLANGIWSQNDCQNWLAGVGSQINGVYESVLGRAADPGSLAWGLNSVAAGVSLTTITQEVASSGECYNDIVRMFENATGGNAPNSDLVSAFQYNLAHGIWSQTDCQNWLAGVGSQINGVYESVLGRAADTGGLAWGLNSVAAGVSMTTIAQELAASQEAANNINSVYEQVLNRSVDPTGLTMGQTILASGGGLAGLRSALAQSAEAQADMNALYQQALGRPATASDLAWAQGALASGASWGQIQADIANSPEAAAAVDAVYEQVLGRPVDAGSLAPAMAALGTEGYAALEAGLATSAEAAGDINAIYEDVLGREADPTGLANFEGVLAQGGTLATVRMDVAQSAEAAGVVQNFYQITFGRATTADELVGMQYAIGLNVPDDATFGLTEPNGTVVALTTAGNLLAQLPVAVTLSNGATPILDLPDGSQMTFANANQLTAAILGLALEQGQASVGTLAGYGATMDWLTQIDQPMLQVAANLMAQAQLAQSEGNQAQQTLAMTAYSLALQIAALPPAARGGVDWGLSSSVQVDGHTTDVIVYNDTSSPYGNVVYHDKSNDNIAGIIEQVVTVVADVLSFVPVVDVVAAPLAAVLNTAEAGQGFAEGNVLGGILSLASAVGFGYLADGVDVAGTGLSGAQATIGSEILAASQALGGSAGIVQSAENGDPLGVAASVLTVAAAAASAGISLAGVSSNQTVVNFGGTQVNGQAVNFAVSVTQALSAAAAGTAIADALNNGDVSTALITSLGPLLSSISSSSLAAAILAPGQNTYLVAALPRTSQNDASGPPTMLQSVGNFLSGAWNAFAGVVSFEYDMISQDIANLSADFTNNPVATINNLVTSYGPSVPASAGTDLILMAARLAASSSAPLDTVPAPTSVTPQVVAPRPLTAEDLGLSPSSLEQLDGTVQSNGTTTTVTINMIQGQIGTPFSILGSLQSLAASQGSSNLVIEATVANPKLYDILASRYGAVTTGAIERITIALPK